MTASTPSPAESPWRIDARVAAVGAAAVLGLAVVLAETYAAVARVSGWQAWLAAASVHTVLAVGVLIVRRKNLGRLLSVRGAGDSRASAGGAAADSRASAAEVLVGVDSTAAALGGLRAYLPAALVLVGTILLTILSRLILGDPPTTETASTRWAWILWVPLVEELVFRVGLGTPLRRRAGLIWGGWLSAALFALVHAAPTLANLTAGRLGLPLGPFLLGLVCEVVFGLTGRLLPVVALHAACNATVAIFAAGDARWLDWLGFLYG